MKDDSDGDKKQQIHHIQNLYAFNLFCQKRFDDSMQVFAKLGTGTPFTVKHLIRLFRQMFIKHDQTWTHCCYSLQESRNVEQ